VASLIRWAILSHDCDYTEGVLTIIVTTDQPVHLTLHHTSKNPRTHLRQETDRGLNTMTNPDYCCVEITPVDQNEPGDTLTHTFNPPDWPPCSKHYYYFTATFAGAPTTSNTAIFTYHLQGHWAPDLRIGLSYYVPMHGTP